MSASDALGGQWAGLPPYEDVPYDAATVHMLPVELVSQFQDPHTRLRPARQAAVTRSLRAGHPIQEPLHIVEDSTNGGRPLLYDGHHRLAAAKKHGLTHVPVRVNRDAWWSR